MASRGDDCGPEARTTKSLLGYGVVAGPFYVLASVAQGLLTPGFSFTRDSWSVLSLGPTGWVHVLVFVLTGAMVVAAAVGFHRLLSGRRGGSGALWLAAYGVLLVVAGLALPDRTGDGFSAHGVAHLAAGGLGFIAFAVACFLLARHFRDEHRIGLAAAGIITGIALLTGFVAIVATAGASGAVLAFTASVLLSWGWLLAASMRAYAEAAERGRHEAQRSALQTAS